MRIQLTILVLGLACVPAAFAQAARSGGGASAQLMQQMQQLASERASLQEENARLKRDLEQARKDLDAAKGGRAGLEQRARAAEVATARLTSSEQSTRAELEQQKVRLQELVAKFRETANTLRTTEADRNELQAALSKSKTEWTSCANHNVALFDLNNEILTRLGSRGGFSRLAELEPFTQLKRVELENLVDAYRGRAEDHRLAPATAAPTPLK